MAFLGGQGVRSGSGLGFSLAADLSRETLYEVLRNREPADGDIDSVGSGFRGSHPTWK